MRRCIGCKPLDWMKFRFESYQSHSTGRGYASPKVCLSAGYAWSRIVRHEFILFKEHRSKDKRWKISRGWQGDGVSIVMHDGSTCTLGTMLKLYLPDADVRLYNKCDPIEGKSYPPYQSRFIVMCEDGISHGNSLFKMRANVERPIDLFLTIGGNRLSSIPEFVEENYKVSRNSLVKIHHQLDQGEIVWVAP